MVKTCPECGKHGETCYKTCRSCYQRLSNAKKPWELRVVLRNKERRANLSQDFLECLRKSNPNCKCCGIFLDYGQYEKGKQPRNQAQLDKIVPDAGYVPSNVAVICAGCNNMKRDSSLADLQMVIDYIKAQL